MCIGAGVFARMRSSFVAKRTDQQQQQQQKAVKEEAQAAIAQGSPLRPCSAALLLEIPPPPSPAATMHCGLDCNVQHLISFLPPNFPAQQNKREQKCLLTILFQVRACWSQC